MVDECCEDRDLVWSKCRSGLALPIPKVSTSLGGGLRVLSKMRCGNGGAQQDIRVEGWRRKKGAYIVFLAGRGFLPVGPRVHGPSQPRAHGVSRNIRTTPCARGSETPCTRGVQKISDETSQDTTAKHTISGISEEVQEGWCICLGGIPTRH